LIDRDAQQQRPRRKTTAPRRKHGRSTVIAIAGAGVWTLLAFMGKAGFGATTAVVVATGLSFVADRYLRKRKPADRQVPDPAGGPRQKGRDARRSRSPHPEENPTRNRPNAASEDYNTLARTKPQPTVKARLDQPPVSTRPAPPPTVLRPAPPPTVLRPAPAPLPPVRQVVPAPVAEPAPLPEALPVASPLPELPPLPAPARQEAKAADMPAPQAPVVSRTDAPTPVAAPAPAPAPASVAASDPARPGYQMPPVALLPVPSAHPGGSDDEHLERAILLENTLKTFGVEATVIDFAYGPAVTRYELQPGPGVRVNKFTSLVDDLALALAAEDIRIEAPIPGKSAVGIEVPNKVRHMVPLREVLESPQFRTSPSKLAVAFGKDNAGNPVVGDLARMPHLLIAGSTGSGKSVCMNTIICSLLFKARPDEVKMLMIDPKMVELSTYNGIPHLIAPVITDVKKAAGYLKGAVKEMEARYELLAALGVRNVQQYNQAVAADPGPDPEHPRKPLPFIVIFIDELADLMMVAPADVEDAICRLAQMARACGMHLVVATQSPRVDVITGLIKANVPSRIAFAVSSQIDSRVIMDSAGAERLLGRGDMLYHASGLSKPIRAQGAFIDEASVDELVRFVKAQGKPAFTAEEVSVDADERRGGRTGGLVDDPLPVSAVEAAFPNAVRVVMEHGQASCSILQRRLRCNYSKAARLIDMMEEKGFIGPHQGSRPRDVLISMAQWQQHFGSESENAEMVELPVAEPAVEPGEG
jgi:S-DNA-T family DNA segregation ATPase FtsK/SpoIIIE